MSDPKMSVDGLGRVRKTHCKYGHEFADDARWATNWKGYKCRVCRECERLRVARKRENPERKKIDREKSATWRQAHPEQYKAGWQATHAKKAQVLLDARVGGCGRCDEKHPACLDFHHRDRTTKEGHIGEFRRFGMKRLLAEIAKCDVLCANCHRKLHHDERNAA